MDKRKQELRRISKDLRQFLAQHCKAEGGKYDDFVGESCDTAYQMLQNTLRRLDETGPAKS